MKEGLFKRISLIIFLFLVFFQVKTTNIKSAYSFTPAEIDLQITRMNEYPPSSARLGYILESKKEIQILKKLESNFFTAIDFNEYFPNRLPFLFSPFVFIGLFYFVRDRKENKYLFYSFLFSLALVSVIGPFAKYGPVLIVVYLIYFVFMGIFKTLNIKII